ncbi:histone acetyltransferase type b catalytic subunit [Anaeramoeba flamelloides]|uniref:Histone acetyltransferase type b catalytic subunit n=1 Tax=Anaeramoeba flamelloides TaxID=1746091 RepID=A0ABQ8YS81_9EUKA|nr:histone acetyltransferase type b catalytic subunit [Anaeramoeba flamelloides]
MTESTIFTSTSISGSLEKITNTTKSVVIYLHRDMKILHKFSPEQSSLFFQKSAKKNRHNPLVIDLHLTPSCREGFFEHYGSIDQNQKQSNRELAQRKLSELSNSLETNSLFYNQTKAKKTITIPNRLFKLIPKTTKSVIRKAIEQSNSKILDSNILLKINAKNFEEKKLPQQEAKTNKKEKKTEESKKLTKNKNKDNTNQNEKDKDEEEDGDEEEDEGEDEKDEDDEEEGENNEKVIKSLLQSIQKKEEKVNLNNKQIISKIKKSFEKGNLSDSRIEFDYKVETEIRTQWSPPGKLITKYKLPLIKEQSSLSNLKFEVFSGKFDDPVFKDYFKSIQHLLIWFDFKNQSFDFKDNFWTIYLLFEKVQKYDDPKPNNFQNHQINQLIKSYNNNNNNNNKKNDKENENEKENGNNKNHDNSLKILNEKQKKKKSYYYALAGIATSYRYFKYPDQYRCRINNFIIFPPYCSNQNQKKFLNSIYLDPLKDPSVFEITSEIESSTFSSIRTQLDLENLWKDGYFLKKYFINHFKKKKYTMKKNNFINYHNINVNITTIEKKEVISNSNFNNDDDDEKKNEMNLTENKLKGDGNISNTKQKKENEEFSNQKKQMEQMTINKESESNIEKNQNNSQKEEHIKQIKKNSMNMEIEMKKKTNNQNDKSMLEEKTENQKLPKSGNNSSGISNSDILNKLNDENEMVLENEKKIKNHDLNKLIKEIKIKTKLHNSQIIKCFQISLFNYLCFYINKKLMKKFRIQIKKRLYIENVEYFSDPIHRKEWLEEKYLEEITEFNNILSRINEK